MLCEREMKRSAAKANANGVDASASSVALSALLSRLFTCSSPQRAADFLASKACSRAQRKTLAELAGLEAEWAQCDQSVPDNVADLASKVTEELFEPFSFFRRSLSDSTHGEPRTLFSLQMATRQMKKQGKFWVAKHGLVKEPWLPPLAKNDVAGAWVQTPTFDAVVHFVQAGVGTGIHIGEGRILTCAHVVDARDDDSTAEDELPRRIGRQKVVMFANMRTFICECTAVEETVDGSVDVALMVEILNKQPSSSILCRSVRVC